MELNKSEIEQLDEKYRLNLINSLSGIKPVNLIGTESKNKLSNLAIFSSVVHLGSSPAQLGFVLRPFEEGKPKDTFRNIQETGVYTINHVTESFAKKAHYTSAKLDVESSEFDKMNIEKEYLGDFPAPFVKESPVKIGMKFLEKIPLPNGCSLVVGEVLLISAPDNSVNELGQIDLSRYHTVGVSGLNTYYNLQKIASFPYVRINEIPEF